MAPSLRARPPTLDLSIRTSQGWSSRRGGPSTRARQARGEPGTAIARHLRASSRKSEHAMCWRSSRSFEKAAIVRGRPEDARALLCDPTKMAMYQPLVREIVSSGAPNEFYITENVPMGCFAYPNKFRARLVPLLDGTGVDTEAWSMPDVHLVTRLRWRDEGGGRLRVSEQVTVDCTAVLMPFVGGTAEKAHAAMVRRMGEAVEAAAATPPAPRAAGR
eukprot:tig00020850_g14674.t1